MDYSKINVEQINQGSSPLAAGNPLTANLDGAYFDGPVVIGTNPTALPLATLNVGPPAPPILPSLTGLFKGLLTENKLGIMNKLGVFLKEGVQKMLGLKSQTGLEQHTGLKNQTGADFKTGLAFSGTLVYQPGHALSAKKNFDISHPTKEGYRLRYVCVETPEAGVYIRGKSTSGVIELPDYWVGFVYEETISVNLTPIGCHQNLYVEKIEGNKIHINGDTALNYYYTIFAERKDCEINIPEYEGQTPADYPGDQGQCSVAGYNY